MTSDERLVVAACAWLLLLPAASLGAVGWVADGGDAAADGLLQGFSTPVMLAVAAFGVVLGASLRRRRQSWTLPARLCCAMAATLAHVLALMGAVMLDGAAATAAAGIPWSFDDGSFGSTVTAVVVRSVLVDLRAPVALVVGWVALGVAARRASPGAPRSRLDLSC